MANKNIKNIGVKFGQGQPTNRGGRPKKIYTILKKKGYSADDIRTAYGEMAFYTIDELKEIVHDKTKPAIMKVVAMSYKNAIEKGEWRYIKEIMEHTIGKAPQTVDVTTNGESMQFKGFNFLPSTNKEENE